MRSFIAKVSELLKLNTDDEQEGNQFDSACIFFKIPLYQREYKWDIDRVEELLHDINNLHKFIGNIILKKRNDYYEIVDGQQRITTLVLVFSALFNKFSDNSNTESLMQIDIFKYIFRNNRFILVNDSVGDYLNKENNSINLSIEQNNDMYRQKSDFVKVFDRISVFLDEIDLDSFVQKLLDCRMQVLISTENNATESIEQIFLDINYKSQLLDVEDIFKGYCFKKYTPTNQEALKEKWASLKKLSFKFKEFFGFTNTAGYKDFSAFLYLYFLSKPETKNVTEKLTQAKVHILHDKNMNDINAILIDMHDYAKNVADFYEKIDSSTYLFDDLSNDSQNSIYFQTQSKTMRLLCKDIMEYSVSQYQKLPFFMFVNYFTKGDFGRRNLNFNGLMRIINDLYIYTVFFKGLSNKSKSKIRHDIIEKLHEVVINVSDIKRIIRTARNATKDEYTSENALPIKFSFYSASAIFSIIDFYNSRDSYISTIYLTENHFTQEHFLLHETDLVVWKNDIIESNLIISNMYDGYSNMSKNLLTNCLIIDDELNNNQLKSFDIVEKIKIINERYEEDMPKHIQIIIEHILGMAEYSSLKELKDNNEQSLDIIKENYGYFLSKYFSDDSQAELRRKIIEALDAVFN